MGLVKRHMDDIEARGYNDADGMVCSVCVVEPALQAVIRAEGAEDECGYCGLVPDAPDATVELERVVEMVTEGLRYEYERPDEGAGWDGREGGYMVPTIDTDDLLFENEVSDQGAVVHDIARAINLNLWCKKDPYASSEGEALKWGWSGFRNYVQQQRRFTFLAPDERDIYGAGDIPMHGMPAAVVEAVSESRLMTVFEAGTTWWRARVHDSRVTPSTAKDIGSPAYEYARDNRMSPKGIGAFYGSSTKAGARAEVAGYAGATDEATLGEFKQLSNLSLVDLRDLPEVPSLFDAGRRHLRGVLSFMRDFITDVTKVADPTDAANLNYIPTQVIAEHLRYDLPADGICWRSTKDHKVTVCVLFLPNSTMSDAGEASGDSKLELDPSSVTHVLAPL